MSCSPVDFPFAGLTLTLGLSSIQNSERSALTIGIGPAWVEFIPFLFHNPRITAMYTSLYGGSLWLSKLFLIKYGLQLKKLSERCALNEFKPITLFENAMKSPTMNSQKEEGKTDKEARQRCSRQRARKWRTQTVRMFDDKWPKPTSWHRHCELTSRKISIVLYTTAKILVKIMSQWFRWRWAEFPQLNHITYPILRATTNERKAFLKWISMGK